MGVKLLTKEKLSPSVIIKKFLDLLHLRNIARKIKSSLTKHIIYNVNKTNYSKRCLLVYIAYPFRVKKFSDTHQNAWQAVEMARVIGTFGYDVDAADFDNLDTIKRINQKYDLIIDIICREPNFWGKNMNEGCMIIIYMTGMSIKAAYENEHRRLAELEQRRGFKLIARRTPHLQPELEVQMEKADAIWYIGNAVNLYSCDYLNMPPVFFIRNNGYKFSWLNRDLVRAKNSFIFFNSGGQVHKGLDLLLDIFSLEEFGKYNLYVCGSFMREEDFYEAYEHELFECKNIFPAGFINIHSDEFRELTRRCAYALMPSCAEGCSGSVLTLMSAGVIPIISRECGVDGEGVINLPDCGIDTIKRYILEYSQKPDEWIQERSSRCVDDIMTMYSKDNFTQSVNDAMTGILKLKK